MGIKMKLSSNKPIIDGWYWLKHPLYAIIPAKIYWFQPTPSSDGLGKYGYGNKGFFMVATLERWNEPLNNKFFDCCYWAGPIKEPKELK